MIAKQGIPTLEQALNGTLSGSTVPVSKDSKKVFKFDPKALVEIEDQPFRLYSPAKLQELADDIKLNGQISPCIIRKKDGKSIVLAGRNRKKACELAGIKVDCIVIECDDATANLIMVNSNMLQRLELLPSEKAFGYKLQKESTNPGIMKIIIVLDVALVKILLDKDGLGKSSGPCPCLRGGLRTSLGTRNRPWW